MWYLYTVKPLANLLILLYSVTAILQPIGNPSSMNFREMYLQCSAEDYDITPLDFVFEHVLNFECVINYFEGEDEEEHQPFRTVESSSPASVSIPGSLFTCNSQTVYFSNRITYPVQNTGYCSSDFSRDVFHPPIADCA